MKFYIVMLSVALSSYSLFGKKMNEDTTSHQRNSDQEEAQRFANQITGIPGIPIAASMQPQAGTPRPGQQAINTLHQVYVNTQSTAHQQTGAQVVTRQIRAVPFNTTLPHQRTVRSPHPTTRTINAPFLRNLYTTIHQNNLDRRFILAHFIGQARERRQIRTPVTRRELLEVLEQIRQQDNIANSLPAYNAEHSND